MTILFSIFLALNAASYLLFNEQKNLRYRHWYRPWLILLFMLTGLTFYGEPLDIFRTYFPVSIAYDDLLFIINLSLLWLIVKRVLNRFKLNDLMENFLKHNNTNKLTDYHGISNYLVWPYLIKGFDIYKRPGRKYILFLFWLVLIVIVIIGFLLAREIIDFEYFHTYIFLLIIPISLEWILYLQADDDIKENIKPLIKPETQKIKANLEALYERYVDEENGFKESVIFGFIAQNRQLPEQRILEKNEIIEEYNSKLMLQNEDIIVSDGYLLENIKKFAPTILNSLKNGGNILFLTDIPDYSKIKPKDLGISHPNENIELTYGEILSHYLKDIIERDIPFTKGIFDIAYYTKGYSEALKRRIILSSISGALTEELLNSEWARNIDLIIVIQENDSYFDNLVLSRNLSLWLDQFNNSFRLLFFKPYTTGGDDSLTNIWISSIDPKELKLENIQTSSTLYFIDFAFEKSRHNLRKIFSGETDEFDITPGIELSIFALLEDLEHIHYFEGFNVGFLQSKNLLSTKYHSLKTEIISNKKVSQSSIERFLKVNNSPIVFIDKKDKLSCKDEHLSIIYDIENNAPRLYKKYINLGKNETFICVVSKPHIFREYFAQNTMYFVQNTINPLQPLYTKSHINLCLQLFYLLQHNEVSIKYIEKVIHAYSNDIQGMSTVQYIEELFEKYLDINIKRNSIIKTVQKEIFNEENKQFEDTFYLSIEKTAISQITSLHFTEIIKIQDTSGNTLMKLPKYLTFQNILPQQGIIINGIYYEYRNFDIDKNILRVEAKPQDSVLFYAPIVQVEFNNQKETTNIDTKEALKFFIEGKELEYSANVKESKIKTFYNSFLKFQNNYHSPSANTGTPQKVNLSNDISKTVKREYYTRFLHLKWEVSEKFSNQVDEIGTYFHILLFEILKVMYPYHHQYLHILSDNKSNPKIRESLPWIFTENNFKFNSDSNKYFLEFIISEDSFSDLGLLNPLKEKFEMICRYLYDYLLWVQSNDSEIVEDSFLRIDKNQRFFETKADFLKYGLKDFNWDFNLIAEFIKENAFFDSTDIAENFNNRNKQGEEKLNVECDFCGKSFKINEVVSVEGGLQRCSSCAENACDDEESAQKLHDEAKSLYMQILNENFNELNYSFNFVDYASFAKRFNIPFKPTHKYDKRKAIGKAIGNISDDTERIKSLSEIDEIWIEKFRKNPETLSIIVHEMIHIYQYQKLNYLKMKYSEPKLIEGMTTWAEWYLLSKSEKEENQEFAEKQKLYREKDNSEYGIGFRYVNSTYQDNILKQIHKKYGIPRKKS